MKDKHHIIIDGYNYILRSEQLDPDNENALWEARERLIHRMINYLGNKKILITIVFDGQDIKGIGKRHRPSGIRVRFSKAPQKADPLILGMIEKSSNPRNISVVTSDKTLARLAAGFGSKTMTVFNFSNKLSTSQQDFEYIEKFKGQLSKQELNDWLQLFGERSE